MATIKNETGKRYGELQVLYRVANNRAGNACWLCQCICGATQVVSGLKLRSGHTKSCGHDKQGAYRTPTYYSWRAMLERCERPEHEHYAYYGGRGIWVCRRWHFFKYFLQDMGERPPGTTLDRIDPDGDYKPANCRWATRREQRCNQRAVEKLNGSVKEK